MSGDTGDMQTIIINSADTNSYSERLLEAAAALREGALVVFPTETVYGIAASAAHPGAVGRLRSLKGRADKQPFTVHIASRAEASAYAPSVSPVARRLARKAWPGPLTLICPVSDPERAPVAERVPESQLGEIYDDGKVGLRCPDHPVSQRLLREAGVPMLASSANRQGESPPTEFHAALERLDGEIDYAIDAGRTRLQSPSTIVEISGKTWSVQRAGGIEERVIRRLATSEILMVCTGNSCRSPLAEHLFRRSLAKHLGLSLAELTENGYVVASAGTAAYAGGPISRGSVEELDRRGIDASGHSAQPLTIDLIRRSERIFALAVEHRERALELASEAADRVELLDAAGSIPDPIGGGPEDYRECAAHIERVCEQRAEEFADEDRDW